MFDYRKHVLKKIIKKNNFEREKLILNDKNIKRKKAKKKKQCKLVLTYTNLVSY